MMFAALSGWFFGAIVMPTVNALASHRIARDAQGELQGAAASLFSLSAIMGPPIMTHLFARFTAPDARFHVPGAVVCETELREVVGLLACLGRDDGEDRRIGDAAGLQVDHHAAGKFDPSGDVPTTA